MLVKMFASLKNKIREETGSDVVIKVNAPLGKRGPTRGRHSRQGSTTSLNSIVSGDGYREDLNVSPALSKTDEDELQKILAKKEAEFEKRLKDRERDWQKQMEDREKDRLGLEKDKEELDLRVQELEELLKISEEQKRKLASYRDDKEQLESLQTQEIAKVKHLLLAREKELAEKISVLKESGEMVESLRSQISRLRHSEQELSCVQVTSGEQLRELKERLSETELRADNAQAESAHALASCEREKQANESLRSDIEKLKKELECEQFRCNELCSSYEKERSEKDVTLLRNAQVSQEVEIARQKIANQDTEINELHNRLSDLERSVIDKESQINGSDGEIQGLKSIVSKLEDDILERDKNIKILQQRLAIMKKTLQRELRSNDSEMTSDSNLNDTQVSSPAAVLAPSSHTTKFVGANETSSSKPRDEEDINFKYLKHVIIKFLTSREYEAKHLTRAVSTLLKFSPEEEKLLQETLEWKMSWFGSRPKVGNGQLAKAIPPS